MAGERAMESELKFKLKAAQGAQAEHILVSRHPDARGVAQQLTTTYFDTPDLAVSRAGFTLRVRQAGDGFIQTMKTSGTTGGRIAQRSEQEWAVRRARPDFRRLAGTPIAGLRARVVPLFVTDIHRTTYLIPLGAGAIVEVAIDDGEIRAGGRTQPVRELEIELKSGPAAALYAFAAAFHAALPLEIAAESKAARGYRLISGGRPENQKAGKLALAPDMSLAQGIQAVVGHGLGHLMGNLAAIDDIEGLHQARVAIRRLRSALVLFDSHLAPHVTGRFEVALRRFGRVLGEARDWDVFVWEAIPHAESDGVARPWLDMLGDRAGPFRAHARVAATTLTVSAEFTAFILALAGWIENIGEAGRLREILLSDAAPAMLEQLQHKVMKRGRQIAKLDAEELHDLRKTLKKLRYGSDYLASLFEKKAVKRYRKGCDALQEVLGTVNDAATAERLLVRLGSDDDLHLTPAIGLFAEWNARRRAAALARLPVVWEAFAAVAPPWV
jgi:triphosphatase